MRYLGNLNNLVRTAVVSALNILPSEAMYRQSVTRTGGGQVRLAGSYDGQADTTIDVEIRNSTLVGAPRMSSPTFVGVGNGTMTNAAATAAVAAQEITVTLVDLGTDTRQAYTPFQGVTLRAVDAGAGGNAITITVSETGITRADSDYAVAEDMRADFNEYVGDEWNFGHAVLTPEGTIPTSAPRLAFGDDPQVYRAYKEYKDGRYVYSFSPAIVRDVPKGTVVKTVTGSRTVTVTDGVDTDTYTSVTTLYSLLSQIAGDADALLEVDGAVVNDQLPGGMGVVEMSVRTAAYAKATIADGSSYVQAAQIGLTVAADAPTETLTIECTNAEHVGSENWQVKGTLSGELAPATTGVAYDGTNYDFTVPHIESRDTTESASLTYQVDPEDRSASEADPDIVLYRPVLGRNARDMSLTFTYTRRPAPDCDATEVSVEGSPNPDCLGLEPQGVPVAITPRHQARLERISQFVNTVVRTQQAPFKLPNPFLIEGVNAVAGRLAEQLSVLMNEGELDHDAWVVGTAYAEGAIVVPTTANGLRYRAENAGTSHAATEPTWPTTQDGTVSDNGITWKCIGKTPIGMFDDCLSLIEADYEHHLRLPFNALRVWAVSANITPDEAVYPTARNGRIYIRTAPNTGTVATDATTEPTWPTTDYATVTDNGITWMAMPAYWAATTAKAVGDVGFAGTRDGSTGTSVYGYWRVKTAGTTGASEPDWESKDYGEITDGTVVWEYIHTYRGSVVTTTDVQSQLLRVNALIGPALAAAGLEPDFEQASSTGNGCWRDDEDATHWWVPSDQAYLPAFTGVYYHATKTGYDLDGNEVITPTMEFGFAIQACGMIEGDSITITISGAGGGRAYQVGDKLTTQIVRGQPLQLGGGQTGTDTLTWSVRGSVAGAFADYALDKTTPNAYSNGGLSFQITSGGIDFALGDTFTLFAEGGQFRWRADGGAWSADTQIADSVSIGANGLELEFVAGAGPSFVAGDTYTWVALAVNGPAHLTQPTDGALSFDAATEIVAVHAGTETVRDVLIADHTIPSTATITLKTWNGASYDTEATIPWAAGTIYYRHASDLDATRHRIDVDDAGSIGWLFMGENFEAEIRGGSVELGRAIKRIRLPNGLVARGQGVDVRHEALAETSADALVDLIAHATENDEGRFAIVLNDTPSMVQFVDETMTLEDINHYQPTSAEHRYIAVQLQLQPAA